MNMVPVEIGDLKSRLMDDVGDSFLNKAYSSFILNLWESLRDVLSDRLCSRVCLNIMEDDFGNKSR